MNTLPGLGASARWLSVATALVLSACASVGEGPTALIAPRPTAITPSPSGTSTATPTAPVALVIGVEATPTPCSTASILATWTVTRLAEQTIVIPVDENNVMSIRSEVAAGAGGGGPVGLAGPTQPRAPRPTPEGRVPQREQPIPLTARGSRL